MKKIMILTFFFVFCSTFSESSEHIFILSENCITRIRQERRVREIRQFNQRLKTEKPELYLLAMKESAHRTDTVPDYTAWNEFGFVGAWQINIHYMEYLSITPFTIDEFMTKPDEVFPPELQLIAVERMVEKNRVYLRNYWHYVGQYIHGIEITETGIIFAAHLAGHQGVKNFINYGRNPSDAFGTKLTDYLKTE